MNNSEGRKVSKNSNSKFELLIQTCILFCFYYASIGSLSLGRAFSGCFFFDISSTISWCGTTQLSKINPGGSEERVVRRNTRRKRDNKNTLRTIL